MNFKLKNLWCSFSLTIDQKCILSLSIIVNLIFVNLHYNDVFNFLGKRSFEFIHLNNKFSSKVFRRSNVSSWQRGCCNIEQIPFPGGTNFPLGIHEWESYLFQMIIFFFFKHLLTLFYLLLVLSVLCQMLICEFAVKIF